MSMGNIANTGMNAAMTAMEVTSNNIANAGTYGFKSATTNFADIYPGGLTDGSNQPGLGVSVSSILQNFETGGFTSTGTATDMAITTQGFFIISDPVSGQTSYTRNGQFVTEGGYLVNSNGIGRVQGFPASNNTIVSGASPTDIAISTTPMNAQATATVNAVININSSLPISTGTFDPTNPTTYAYSSTCPTVYDSLGNAHMVALYYVKTALNTYTVQGTVDGTALATPLDGSLIFDGNGQISSVTTPLTVTFSPVTGATAPQSVNINLTGSTQNGNASQATLIGDGYMAGTFNGISIDNNGNVSAQYTNGQNNLVGQIALANFQNPQGLTDIGNMSWTIGANSGSPTIIQASSTGAFQTSQLELSNVDLATEMINLITFQNTFQANAQVEQTYNEVVKTITQL